MKVILCTGGPQSDHEKVFEILLRAGLVPAQAGRQIALSPHTLQRQLLLSQEVDLSGAAPLTQVQPGKVWSQLATDLFLTNIHHAAWGWADHQTTLLMDFWKEFEPQVRLLLVYNSPQAYLAQVLDQHTPPTPKVVAAALNKWTHWNTALLRYYHRHPGCCVLVNAQHVGVQPQMFVDALVAHWQISGLDSTAIVAADKPAYQHLQAHLISQIIDPHDPALVIHQELEGAAMLMAEPMAGPTTDASPAAAAAWTDWVQVRTSFAQLTLENLKLIADSFELEAARAELDTQKESNLQAAALKQENELLLVQLRQVQEKLEVCFIENQTLAQQAEQVDRLNAELTNTRSQCNALTHEKAALWQAHKTAIAEKAAATHARDATQVEKVQLAQQVAQLETQLAQATQAGAHISALKQENELLQLQLRQVQEELEHYFLRAQALEKDQQSKASGFVTDFWRLHQPTELVISMQRDIAGSNWYPVESDSRWAGPATMSTLQIPPVQPGNYMLELDVVDAMNLAIVDNLLVEVLGQTKPMEVFYPRKRGKYPVICKVPLTIPQSTSHQPWEIGLRFVETVSPAVKGSDDSRNLGIRLRTLKLVKKS